MLWKAERSLLNIRMGQIVHKIRNQKDDCECYSGFVYGSHSRLPSDVQDEVTQCIVQMQLREHELVKKCQQTKFACLFERNQEENKVSLVSECITKWVKNYSKRLLSDLELSVLAKGL